MRLPRDEIGISDILGYRDCPQRFAFQMRRHVELPERMQAFEGERDDPPEATNTNNAYGSAVHDAIRLVEETDCSDDEAIDAAWPAYQHWLEPADQDRMRADLATFRSRTTLGYRLVGAELELRTPLMTHEGRTIYFRGRIDVLYQRIDNPAVFLSRDYKSSRWPKSHAEVQQDIQQWSYNWLVHQVYPECMSLLQQYDQLRFGSIPTSKTTAQRTQIHEWLQRQVRTILEDDTLRPLQNEWCQFCPLLMDCRVTHQSTDWWINRLGALAPEKKVGRKIVVQLTEEHAGMEVYAELLPKAKNAQKILERFTKAVEQALKEMPQERREELGYGLTKGRITDEFDASALRAAHALLGDDFYQVIGMTKTALDDFVGSGPLLDRILALAEKRASAPSIKQLRS